MKNLLAVNIPLGPPGGFQGQGPLGLNGVGADQAPTLFNKAISTTIGVMTVVAFIWFVIQFFIGAVGYITSGGDKAAVENARQKITVGLIGIIVVISALFVIKLIGTIIGIDLLGGALFVSNLGF